MFIFLFFFHDQPALTGKFCLFLSISPAPFLPVVPEAFRLLCRSFVVCQRPGKAGRIIQFGKHGLPRRKITDTLQQAPVEIFRFRPVIQGDAFPAGPVSVIFVFPVPDIRYSFLQGLPDTIQRQIARFDFIACSLMILKIRGFRLPRCPDHIQMPFYAVTNNRNLSTDEADLIGLCQRSFIGHIPQSLCIGFKPGIRYQHGCAVPQYRQQPFVFRKILCRLFRIRPDVIQHRISPGAYLPVQSGLYFS